MTDTTSPTPSEALALAVRALEPFAEPLEELDDIAVDLRCEDDAVIEDALFRHQQPTVGDLRRARAALQSLQEAARGGAETDENRPITVAAQGFEGGDEALQSIRQISQPDSGWRLVPIEPTEEMIAALSTAHTKAMVAMFGNVKGPEAHRRAFAAAYRAMLSAAFAPLDLPGDDAND